MSSIDPGPPAAVLDGPPGTPCHTKKGQCSLLGCSGNIHETCPGHPWCVMSKIDAGDTAWLLISTALVLLMTPALALFYGGMVRKKNVLSTLMHSFSALPIVSVLWALFGYSLAFGPSHGGLIGSFSHVGLDNLVFGTHGSVPSLAFCAFQMMFAVITPALISGA